MRGFDLIALAASLTTAAATFQGFNYGSTQSDGSVKVQSDFEAEFQTAKNLAGTNGAFTSARLYTMIQGGTQNTVISAIPAAISQDTSLLLGLWASAGQDDFNNELQALTTAIQQFGTQLAPLVVGISVGSEDLYRISPTGVEANSGAGAEPSDIVNYISQVRSAIKGTALSDVTIGHVDTWTAWVNGSNDAVISACDWIGVDAYPYFQNTMSNGIDQGADLFKSAYSATQQAANGKPVWITETGWPVSGSTENLGVPSTQNAKTYWDEVGCDFAFGNVNTWWYTLQDADPVTPNPSFGVVGSTLSDTPLYDLSCSSNTTSSSSSSASSSTSASAAQSTAGSGSGSAATTTSAGTSASGFTSAAKPSSVATGASSAVAAASSGVATGGSGLSPNEGNGNGVTPVSTATPSSGNGSSSGSASGGSTSSGSGASNSTSSTSGGQTNSTSSGSGSGTSTGSSGSSSSSPITSANSASLVSFPVMGSAIVGFAAIVAAL